MISIFFRTIHQIFSVYPRSEAFLLLRDYLRIIVRNRLPFIKKDEERILSYIACFPDRPQFFGMLSEIFFRGFYKLPNEKINSIIDGGANIGLAALYLKWRHPDASVLCFEPNPEALGFLQKNISRNNLSDVKIFPFALGKENGEAELFTSARVKGSTSATTVPPKEIERSFRAPMRRLSDFIESPVDLLKLDVEGAEGQVLEDLEAAGKLPLIRFIVMEYHMYDQTTGYPMGRLLSLLERNNFQCLCFPLFSDINFESPKGLRQYMIYARKHI